MTTVINGPFRITRQEDHYNVQTLYEFVNTGAPTASVAGYIEGEHPVLEYGAVMVVSEDNITNYTRALFGVQPIHNREDTPTQDMMQVYRNYNRVRQTQSPAPGIAIRSYTYTDEPVPTPADVSPSQPEQMQSAYSGQNQASRSTASSGLGNADMRMTMEYMERARQLMDQTNTPIYAHHSPAGLIWQDAYNEEPQDSVHVKSGFKSFMKEHQL